ncbi:MAG: hypothetical protein ACKODE_05430, partial [Acidimicrobiaceae bacterium]
RRFCRQDPTAQPVPKHPTDALGFDVPSLLKSRFTLCQRTDIKHYSYDPRHTQADVAQWQRHGA